MLIGVYGKVTLPTISVNGERTGLFIDRKSPDDLLDSSVWKMPILIFDKKKESKIILNILVFF